MYAIIDIEATGGSPKRDRITEIAIFLYDGSQIVRSFQSLLNPEVPIPAFITKLTGITNKMVGEAPYFADVAPQILNITQNAIFVAHNVQGDYAYLKAEFRRLGYSFQRKKLCTFELSKKILPNLSSYSLGKLCQDLSIPITERHRAGGDAEATVKLFDLLLRKDDEQHIQGVLNYSSLRHSLPPQLSHEMLEELPEETGIYYFHNKKDDIFYVGKSGNIRERVVQNFSNKTPKHRLWPILQKTHRISYLETGSSLIAQLIEYYTIARLRSFRRRYRKGTYTHGIFKKYDSNGYLRLYVKKLEGAKKPLSMYERKETALVALNRKIKKHQLCPSLCKERYLKTAAAVIPKSVTCHCEGKCIMKSDVGTYNYRVHKAIETFKYPHTNFLIIGEGRKLNEQSIVCIEQEQIVGYGYFASARVEDVSYVKENLIPLPSQPETERMLLKYLKANKLDRLLAY